MHAHDLTLQLKPLDPNTLNDPGHLNTHHKQVLRMAKVGGLEGAALEDVQTALSEQMRDYQKAKSRNNVGVCLSNRPAAHPPRTAEQYEHARHFFDSAFI